MWRRRMRMIGETGYRQERTKACHEV
jgi:hypothetical protein